MAVPGRHHSLPDRIGPNSPVPSVEEHAIGEILQSLAMNDCCSIGKLPRLKGRLPHARLKTRILTAVHGN